MLAWAFDVWRYYSLSNDVFYRFYVKRWSKSILLDRQYVIDTDFLTIETQQQCHVLRDSINFYVDCDSSQDRQQVIKVFQA